MRNNNVGHQTKINKGLGLLAFKQKGRECFVDGVNECHVPSI